MSRSEIQLRAANLADVPISRVRVYLRGACAIVRIAGATSEQVVAVFLGIKAAWPSGVIMVRGQAAGEQVEIEGAA